MHHVKIISTSKVQGYINLQMTSNNQIRVSHFSDQQFPLYLNQWLTKSNSSCWKPVRVTDAATFIKSYIEVQKQCENSKEKNLSSFTIVLSFNWSKLCHIFILINTKERNQYIHAFHKLSILKYPGFQLNYF